MPLHLIRRGVDLGLFYPVPRATSTDRAEPEALPALFRTSRSRVPLIDLLRAGEALSAIARAPRGFRWEGTTQNLADPLEVQRLHVGPGDLWIKVNWLSTHPRDASIRLRLGYGAEGLDDWAADAARDRRLVRLVEGLFPETRLVTRSRTLARRLGRVRFLKPIVYANAPGGGALFHHDYGPGQDGVVYAQLVGRTAWLAVPWRVLARHVEDHLGRRVPRLWERAEGHDAAISRVLDRSRRFARRLAADGWLFVLSPGDAIVLPSPTRAATAWHSVFCASRGDNLAVSMGYARAQGGLRRRVFRRKGGRAGSAGGWVAGDVT